MARKPRVPTSVLLASFLVCCAGAVLAGDLSFPPGDSAAGPAVGTQLTPVVAAGGGGYLAVWQDFRSSPFSGPPSSAIGRGIDIYARRLDVEGAPLDAAPVPIAVGFGDQVEPQVAWNGENWLVAWETPCECWSYSSQVRAVRVSPAGTILDPIPIIVHTNAYEGFELASNGSEWLVVTETLRGVRVSAAGEVLNPGGTQLVVRTTTGRHAVVSAQGEYLLAWDSWSSAQGQRFTADLTPIGSPFSLTSVNIGSSGTDYFMVWIIDDTYWDDFVYGRRVGLDGSLGPVVTIAGTGGGLPLWNPAQMSVGWDGAQWWVAWLETARGTVFSRVTPDDTALDFGGIAVDPATPGSAAYSPVVVGRSGGGAQFVWQDNRSGDGLYDIRTGAVDASGSPTAQAYVSTSSRAQFFVDYAAGNTEIMAVYRSDHAGDRAVTARRLDADGNALDAAPIVVHSDPDAGPPAVGFDGTRYMVVWSEGTQVYGKRLQTDGTLVDAAPLAVMEGNHPDVAGLGGDFLVVARRRTIGEHIFQPFSMRVDGATGVNLDPDTMVIGGSFARFPRVIAFDGRWLVVFQRNFTHDNPNSDVRAAFVEPNGTTTGDFVVASSAGEPDVAAAGTNALVVWRTGSPGFGNDIVARFMASDGTLATGTIAVSADDENESEPVVTWNGIEYVVAWTDMRNSIIYFDERTEVYAARVRPDGTVVDPQGFAFGDRAQPEINPAVASLGGSTLIAASSFRDEPEHGIYRFAYDVLPAGNRRPVAAISAAPGQGDIPLAVSFDSVGSTDPDGAVVSYAWDFDDGTTDSTSDPAHTYIGAGNYLAELEVTDDLGASTSNVTRVVAETVNLLPVAVPAADVTSGDPPLSVVFNARDSYDPDQGIQNWEWDFGDGWDYWGSTAYHTFTTAGVFTVTHYAHDFRGGVGAGTLTVRVGQPNEDPVAVAAASVLGGPAPLTLMFDATDSWDPDGTITSYDWDCGDGTTEIGMTSDHTYSAPGNYTTVLTVTDTDGATDTAQVVISVGPSAPPTQVGAVPDDVPLVVNKIAGGLLSLSWGESCVVSDTDYAVYEGPLGAFSEHVPALCSTGGLTNATIDPSSQNSYYLVVAHDDAYQGSYGDDGVGDPRGSGPVQCVPTAATLGCP